VLSNFSYLTNFKENEQIEASLYKPISFSNSFYLYAGMAYQQADFNSLPFYKYMIHPTTAVSLFNTYVTSIGTEKDHLNDDFTAQQGTTWDFGIHADHNFSFRKITSLPLQLELRGNLMDWDNFVEKRAGSGLYYSRFSINGQYQWLGDYEELTLTAGYRFYF